MQVLQKKTCWGVLLCFLVVTTHFAHCSQSYADYENVRDLYELLLQKQMLQDSLNHQMVRKSARSPSLRLRFGKKSDPFLTERSMSGHPLQFSSDDQ